MLKLKKFLVFWKVFKNRKEFWIGSIAVLAAVSLLLGWEIYRFTADNWSGEWTGWKAENSSGAEKKSNDGLEARMIDGVLSASDQTGFFPLAVVIENHLDARPVSGLDKAALVYEAEAEAGITRFLAIFNSAEEIKKIGPVRSARPYFVDWAEEFGALFVHCGGSPEALVQIAKDKTLDFDEFYKGDYFWRDYQRSAPHNVYLSTAAANSYLERIGAEIPAIGEWQFKDDNPPTEENDSLVKVNFPNKDYRSEWRYDQTSNGYVRHEAGKKYPCQSGSGGTCEIKVKNLVVQYVKSEIIDEIGRRKIGTVGEGEVLVCLDGNCVSGKWEKKSKKSRTIFYDSKGNEIAFNRGATWIAALPKGAKAEVSGG